MYVGSCCKTQDDDKVLVRLCKYSIQRILLFPVSRLEMATCHDSEGWGPVSRLRDFDINICFEEGVIFSGVLGILLVASLLRSLSLCIQPPHERSTKSRVVLAAKLVGSMLTQSSRFTDLPFISRLSLPWPLVPVLHL